MAAIANFIEHPMYEAELVKTQIEQGLIAKARQTFALFSTRYPEHDMLNTLIQLLNNKH